MARTKKRSQATSKVVAKAMPLVDVKLKRRWEEARRAIEAARRDEAKDFDLLWEAVGDVINSHPPLYLAASYANEQTFLTQFVGVDPDTGRRKARVAKFATAAEIEAFGDTKLDALLDYLEAQAGGTLPGKLPVALGQVRVPVVKDGATKNLTIAEATREQLRAATRARKAKTGKQAAASPRAMALRAALDREGMKGVEVTVHRDGFDLRSVPWDEFATFLRAMAKVKLPE